MSSPELAFGLMQRSVPVQPETLDALSRLRRGAIVIDASPVPIIPKLPKFTVIHRPDPDGFFPIALLQPLFEEFVKTSADRMLLIEGDMVPDEAVVLQAEEASTNTKAFYVESDPSNPYAYTRREGLAGLLMRSEIERMLRWMQLQPPMRLRRYEGYCDSFLWYAVSEETTGYAVSTSGPSWIRIHHLTHDDYTRVTKKQREDMKLYRARLAAVISLAMECNRFENARFVDASF